VALGVVAALELVALLAVGGVRLAPAAHRAAAVSKPAAQKPAAHRVRLLPPTPLRPRKRVRVLVLNGNGVSGAAARTAQTLELQGYRVGGTSNAPRHNYAQSMVMFVPGWNKEARRLARDAGVRLVTPLDGLVPSKLKGSKLVLLLGT
jgi:LytR cell envelope-related transcriptional attenuator